MQRSASALAEAGNSINESIALVTAANSVIQNPEQVGTALKTLSLRIRGVKTELEDAGLETEGMAETTSQLQAKLMALTNGKVNIMLNANEFKNTTQVLREMAAVWDEMTDVQQAASLELLGGKRQANILSSIINNFQTVEDVIQSSAASSGSALKENEVYLDSMQGRIDKLTNSMQAMWVNAMDSGTLKGLISIVDVFVQIIDKVGLANTVIAAFMGKAAFGAKKFGILNMIPGWANAASGAFKGLGMSATAAATGVSVLNAVLTGLASIGIGLLIGGAIKLADELIVTSEEIKEAANQAQDAIASLASEFKQDAKTVNDYAERFAELAQGVDMLSGKNLSLTTDDYEEFLDLSNQLADIFPTLSRNYDENGNAIIQLSGDTNTMVGSLQALLDVQRQLTNQKIAENLPDLYKGVKQQSDEYNTQLKALEAQSSAYRTELEKIANGDVTRDFNDYLLQGSIYQIYADDLNSAIALFDEYKKAFDKAGEELGLKLIAPEVITKFDKESGQDVFDYLRVEISNFDGSLLSLPFDELTKEEQAQVTKFKEDLGVYFNDVADAYSKGLNDVTSEIEITKNENKANWSSLLSSIFSWLTTEESYQVLSDDMQSVVQAMVNNIDFSKLNNVDTWEKMQKYIQDEVISKIQGATPEVQDAFAQLFKIKPNNKTTAEYINAIKVQAQKITNSSDFTYDEVLKNTGFDDIINQYETSAQDILRVLDDSIPKYYEQYEAGTVAHFNSLEKYDAEVEILKDKIYSLSPDEVTRSLDIIKKYGVKTWDDLVEALESKTFDVVLNYDAEKEGMDGLLTAIEESVSATGLSAESIAKLKSRYSELVKEGYNLDILFEETTNGIHLNTIALNELEEAYAKQKTDDLNDKLEGLVKQYNRLTKDINECSDSTKRADLYAQRDNIISQIRDTATLASQYQGLTSAYQQWQNAQSGGNERDMYAGIISGKKELEDEMKRGWLDESSRKYLELLSGKDLSTAKYDEILKVYKELNNTKNGGYNVFDFFTKNSDGETTKGIFNFFDAVIAKQKELGKEWVKISEDGSYSFDFGVNGDKAVAEALGISEELVQIILRAARDAGFDINLTTAYSELADLRDMAEEVNNKLKEIGATDYTFNIYSTNLEDINYQITKAQDALNTFKSSDGTINVKAEGYQEAQTLLATLIRQKQSLETPAVLEVDTNSASTEVQSVMALVKEFKDNYNTLEVQTAIGEDTTDTQAKLNETVAKLQESDPQVLATLGIDPTQALTDVNVAINNITPEMFVNLIPDETALAEYKTATENGENDIEAKVTWQNVSGEVDNWRLQNHDITPSVIWQNDVSKVKTTFTANGYIKWNVEGEANGTAHALGTLPPRNSAFAQGNWGAPKTETALVGELGPELLVRGNQWTTIGENGAEFTQVKKGDIIFNHKQTEQLLKNGYVTSRGKAYASGTAYSSGDGPGRYTVSSATIKSTKDKVDEVFDWIEVRLEEIKDQIDLRNAKLDNTVGFSKQNAVIEEMLDLNEKLYDNLIAGANKYYEYANKLLEKIPSEYRQAAQDGSIAIEEFAGEADEKTLEAIKDFREWVQKGDDAVQQAEEVLTEISSLAKQAIDNIATDFGNKNSIRDNAIDQLDAYNALAETKYGNESEAIYQDIIKNTNENIKALQTQRDEMQAELNKQVEAGNIKKYSQDWYDAVNDIAAVDTEIINLTTDTYDYQDSINELHWDHFDNLLSRLEAISDEADNLIDILGSKDLVDKDTGEWTDEGIASLGLYAQKMEVAEMQAQKYADEIDYLNENWEELGYTEQEYLEKLAELKEGQYDAIKSYNDSKDAIVDLNKARIDAIKDGIQKEIDAYSELIKKKKEELDAEKDLHDFQKGVMEQQKDIADLERQLAALSADNSASARAKRAKLEAELAEARADLEETYYDRSISNQQDALDKELENFQESKDKEMEGWDEYLENTEQVVADSLSTVQANTDTVYQTLKVMGEEYSLSIAESLTSPWKDGENAIQSYSEKFGLAMSSTVEELKELEAEYKELMNEIENSGEKFANQVDDNAKSYTEAEYKEPAEKEEQENEKPKDEEEKPSLTKGSYVELKPGTRWYADSYGGGASGKAKSGKIKYINEKGSHPYNIDGAGWVRKKDIKGYKLGTTNIGKSDLYNLDELGEELIIRTHNGRITYLEKGSGVIPADLTSNLMKWGKLNPQDILDRNRPAITPSKSIVNNEININMNIAEVVHIDEVTNDTIPDLTKAVQKQMDSYMAKLNNSLKRFTR